MHATVVTERLSWGGWGRFPFHTGQRLIIEPCCDGEAGRAVAAATLRRVGGRRLELIGNVIISREGLAAVLHLREQLQGLLLLLGGVVAQQVGGGGEDRRAAGPGHEVEADGKRHVYERAVVLFMLLLQGQDEFRGPVTEADDGGTLEHW